MEELNPQLLKQCDECSTFICVKAAVDGRFCSSLCSQKDKKDGSSTESPKQPRSACVFGSKLTCEFCGIMDDAETFGKSKRFCSKSCSRKFSRGCAKKKSKKKQEDGSKQAFLSGDEDFIPKLKCEYCGKIDSVETFVKSKRFCSKSCGKKFSSTKTKNFILKNKRSGGENQAFSSGGDDFVPKLKCECCGKIDYAENFVKSKRFCSVFCTKRFSTRKHPGAKTPNHTSTKKKTEKRKIEWKRKSGQSPSTTVQKLESDKLQPAVTPGERGETQTAGAEDNDDKGELQPKCLKTEPTMGRIRRKRRRADYISYAEDWEDGEDWLEAGTDWQQEDEPHNGADKGDKDVPTTSITAPRVNVHLSVYKPDYDRWLYVKSIMSSSQTTDAEFFSSVLTVLEQTISNIDSPTLREKLLEDQDLSFSSDAAESPGDMVMQEGNDCSTNQLENAADDHSQTDSTLQDNAAASQGKSLGELTLIGDLDECPSLADNPAQDSGDAEGLFPGLGGNQDQSSVTLEETLSIPEKDVPGSSNSQVDLNQSTSPKVDMKNLSSSDIWGDQSPSPGGNLDQSPSPDHSLVGAHPSAKDNAMNANQKTSSEHSGPIISSWKLSAENICPYCNEVLKNAGSFSVHLLKSHGVVFQCQLCDITFRSLMPLLRHRFSKHSVMDELPIDRCEICSACFSWPGQLRKHMKTKHTGRKEMEKMTCSLCDCEFNSDSLLMKHVREIHSTDDSPKESDNVADKDSTGCVEENKYNTLHADKESVKHHSPNCNTYDEKTANQCKICGCCFSSPFHLKVHGISHSNEKRHTCIICGRKFKNLYSLRKHIRENMYKESHRRNHNGKRNRVCEICGASYTSMSDFKSHMRSHSNDTKT